LIKLAPRDLSLIKILGLAVIYCRDFIWSIKRTFLPTFYATVVKAITTKTLPSPKQLQDIVRQQTKDLGDKLASIKS